MGIAGEAVDGENVFEVGAEVVGEKTEEDVEFYHGDSGGELEMGSEHGLGGVGFEYLAGCLTIIVLLITAIKGTDIITRPLNQIIFKNNSRLIFRHSFLLYLHRIRTPHPNIIILPLLPSPTILTRPLILLTILQQLLIKLIRLPPNIPNRVINNPIIPRRNQIELRTSPPHSEVLPEDWPEFGVFGCLLDFNHERGRLLLGVVLVGVEEVVEEV